MNNYYIISIVLLAIFLLLLFALLYSPLQSYKGLKNPQTIQTADFETLKKVVQHKIKTVRNKSGWLSPYNSKFMDIIEDTMNKSTTISELAICSMLIPNNSMGTYPLKPLGNNPIDTTLFQFEQGNLGWYWGFATYTNPISNIMYYLIRVELGDPEVRKKFNLPLGSTTVYSVSMGMGINGQWVYSPFVICPGKYEIFSQTEFKFTPDLSSINGNLVFQTTGSPGNFEVSMNWDNNYTVSNFTSSDPPHFNSSNGCAPCAGGAGTLYWSYTNLKAASSISIGSKSVQVQNGNGWLDRQWLRGNDPKQLLVRIIENIQQTSSHPGGLPRYMWIPIILNDKDIQYMNSAFPGQDLDIQVGQTFDTKYHTYSGSRDPIWGRKGKVEIKGIKTVGGITWPVKFAVTVDDFDGNEHTYIVDATTYGDCITIDLTSNLHWSGSASLQGGIGTAFLEGNHFQKDKDYWKKMFNTAGMPSNTIDVYGTSAITKTQAIPSILILVLLAIILLSMIGFTITGVVKTVKTSRNKSIKSQ